tara:strand:+ start:151 stop:321 length:171 start_codon:yes stop_codon:yes gene_type:complete
MKISTLTYIGPEDALRKERKTLLLTEIHEKVLDNFQTMLVFLWSELASAISQPRLD